MNDLLPKPVFITGTIAGGAESGWVVLTTLLLLIPMTLASLSLSRSVDTGNVIAGNLGFRHAATHSGEIGIEAAIHFLQQSLKDNRDFMQDSEGYRHCVGVGCNGGLDSEDPSTHPDKTWNEYWDQALASYSSCVQGCNMLLDDDPEIRYVIQRLCNAEGECAIPPYMRGTMTGTPGLISTGQSYFRITCRVKGPGNSTTFLQTIALI